ncbi:MAG: hypothetical protein QF570_04560 [Myxococcota bacterium]|jgi:tetratricopeptide (TPR) repeat protein|nr:hypothetical protein [Myxococcota bacterium]
MHDWEFVELVRESFVVDRTLRALFDRFQRGAPCFEEVALLVGDSEDSILFRLKERCHALFRRDPAGRSEMHREVLFDLTVGSLFHEAMKLRENLYQQEVYVPQVEALLDEHGTEDLAFLREFQKIQEAGAGRTLDAMRETEVLLGQTRKQLRALLKVHADNGLLIRNLIDDQDDVEETFGCELTELLAELHESAAEGYRVAAHSCLESAFFESALRCLDVALEAGDSDENGGAQLKRLRCYAEGMGYFTAGKYDRSIDSLERWIEANPAPDEGRYLVFAELALSRMGKLVDSEIDAGLIERADTLVEVIRGYDTPQIEA